VADAGVIVQDVDAALGLEDGLGEGLKVFGSRDVECVRCCAAADLARHGGGRLGIEVGYLHLRAVPCQ
jgi:hypothetical protein